MRKLCLFLALLLWLTGCSKVTDPPPTSDTPKNQIVTLDVYAVNDLHGKLADTDTQPGVDELSTYLKQAQQTGNTLLLATGDMWQGASESNLTGGFIVTEWMNRLGFAAMTIGGHEFDWGEQQIRKNNDLATFPLLGINVYNRSTDTQVDYCQSSVVVEVDGVQIGIIGAIGDCYYSIASENTKDIYFKTGDDLTALVKAEAEALRTAGVDCILYTLHDGGDKAVRGESATSVSDAELSDYYDIALSDGYVDLVLEADSHYTYTLTDRYGIYHLQAGGNNSGISHAQVQINKATGEVTIPTAETVSADAYNHMEDDPVVEELLDKYTAQIDPATRILGTNRWYRTADNLCQIVANLYSTVGEETWGDDYDIVLGGGYISCRSPMHLPAGEVSYSQLLSLFPFDNQIVLCRIRGRDLVNRFLETENEAYYVKTTDYYETIRNDIDPDAHYYVVTDTYSANYSYNHMTIVESYTDGIFARDLLADYIANGKLA